MWPVVATVFTDPYCPWSWAAEPQLGRLEVEFGDELAYTFVIVGLRRTIDPSDARALALTCLDAAERSGMPVDLPGPRAPGELWRLALEWRVKPRGGLRELAQPPGGLWEPASPRGGLWELASPRGAGLWALG